MSLLTSLLQCRSKCLYTRKSLLRFFGKCYHNHPLDIGGNRWILLTHGRWGSRNVLIDQLSEITTEGPCASEPFVNDDAQCILIAGWARLTADLFRCRIMDGARISLG